MARRYTIRPPHSTHSNGSRTQELFHHLCIAHFRHWFRLIHPQSTVHLRQLLSTHPVGKEPEVSHHLKKLLRDVLFQPRDQLPLCQRFRRRFSRFVVQVTEAQTRSSVVMRQPGSRYWWLLQITTQVACRIPPSGCLLRHVHMPVFSAGFQHQASPL
uniref:Transposase n=1 Tax=Escherichia coli TaxID=562 RepID=A0A3G4RT01_ECOLX|nr:transposase [Escherichia coli]